MRVNLGGCFPGDSVFLFQDSLFGVPDCIAKTHTAPQRVVSQDFVNLCVDARENAFVSWIVFDWVVDKP